MTIVRGLKCIAIIPWYIFLILGGFIGWGTPQKDAWDDLCKWAKK